MPMTPEQFEERRQRRLGRLATLAIRYDGEAASTLARARSMAETIPFGQPILVGHHSERGDRAFRGRIESGFRRGYGLLDKADRYRERLVAALANTSISSDDPSAINQLREKLHSLEADQALMIAINKAVRKSDKQRALADIGLTEAQIEVVLTPDCFGGIGTPSYRLSNNNANIKRVRDRIAILEAAAQRSAKLVEYAWGEYREDVDENRVRLIFNERQPSEVVAALKARGFKWSPSNSAWQRQLNNSAIWAAREIINAHLGGWEAA